jgi:hypothetical protein
MAFAGCSAVARDEPGCNCRGTEPDRCLSEWRTYTLPHKLLGTNACTYLNQIPQKRTKQ